MEPLPDEVSNLILSMSVRDLMRSYSGILSELRRRDIVRTQNAPTGDLAEYLVAETLGGRRQANSAKGGDVLLPDGRRIQVKARVLVTETPGERQLSPFRSFDFDEAAIVLFDRDYGIYRAVRLPATKVEEVSTYRSHVNGHILHATEAVLRSPGAVDFTEPMRIKFRTLS